MKKHRIEFTAYIRASILIEGDETPKEAEEYVKKTLRVSIAAEGVDADIDDETYEIEDVYEEAE